MIKKMTKIFISIITVFVFLTACSGGSANDELENKIDKLLSKMTLEEKVGQMTQVTLGVLSSRDPETSEIKMDMDKLREAVVEKHVGSILNTAGQANTVENWHEIITSIQDLATKETRVKIPVLYGIDAIHGASYTTGATLFPQSIAMAATRNRNLVERGAEITAYEVRASGIPWDFNPVLGLGREPLWSRFWETFGEDAYLASELGKSYVKGLQGDDMGDKTHVAACIKHYLGYSVPKNGKDRTPAWIPERMLRELFLPPFAAAVEQGAMTLMVNSSEINGIPTHSNYHVLTEILKGELGFQGFVDSDWRDIERLYTRDRVADSPEEAVRMAVMAGVDMSMVPFNYSFYDILLKLVEDGKVPMARIDDAVRRILRVKFMLGLFENPYPDKSLAENFASEEFDNANLEAAREAITLLQNKNAVLPLSKNSKVLVTGPTADRLSVLNGGWSITWQGNSENLYPQEKQTVLEAVQEKIGSGRVTYFEGVDFEKDINSRRAIAAARNADAVVLCLGEPTYCETPGNITDLEMTKTQLDFAEKISAQGKPVIVVLIEGRPRVISRIVNNVDAIVMAYLPGMEGGRAIADVLFGDVNPSGKLPFSYPSSVNGYTTYDYKPIEFFFEKQTDPPVSPESDYMKNIQNYLENGKLPEGFTRENVVTLQWPFGSGLSYTTFNYSDLILSKSEISRGEKITIEINLSNSGDIDGKEAVELYLTDLFGTVSRPNKQLKRFKKVFLKAGETKTVKFELDESDFSFIGRDNKRIVESGKFIVTVGGLQKSFVLK